MFAEYSNQIMVEDVGYLSTNSTLHARLSLPSLCVLIWHEVGLADWTDAPMVASVWPVAEDVLAGTGGNSSESKTLWTLLKRKTLSHAPFSRRTPFPRYQDHDERGSRRIGFGHFQ